MFWSNRTCFSGIDTILKWGQLSNNFVGGVRVTGGKWAVYCHLTWWCDPPPSHAYSADTGYQFNCLTCEHCWGGIHLTGLTELGSILLRFHLMQLHSLAPFISCRLHLWSLPCIFHWQRARIGPNVCPSALANVVSPITSTCSCSLFSHMHEHFAHIGLDYTVSLYLPLGLFNDLLFLYHYYTTHTHTCTLTPHTLTHLTLHTVHHLSICRLENIHSVCIYQVYIRCILIIYTLN